jgi:FkbM family methyltransferase
VASKGSGVAGVLQRLSVAAGGLDWKRAALDSSVLRAALPARARMARHRATLPEASARERAFAAASASYREAVAASRGSGEDSSAGALATAVPRRMDVDGLRWSVPQPAANDAASLDRYAARQDFPYRAILQTRELGIGGIMLDIGANNGRMAVPRAVLGDASAVYCAEPEPRNYECLVRNVVDNGLAGLVMPDRVAIGAENGTARLVRAKSPGGHRITDPGALEKRATIEVPTLTLDTWCERIGVDPRQVAFVKIDAQGSEVPVLRGAAGLLSQRHVAWQVEVDLATLGQRGFTIDDLFAVFRRHFTHWIDMNPRARGGRVRPVAALAEGLAYLKPRVQPRTDVLVFNLGDPAAGG